ncbi:hypothetical protein BH18CHL2_BH18CHL2_05750 [soil metagenome]
MTTCRVRGTPVCDLDLAVARVSILKLVKSDTALWMSFARESRADVIREMALCGLDLVAGDAPATGADLVPALARSLAPLETPRLIETVVLRRVPLAIATAKLLERRWLPGFRSPNERQRKRCRDLLHDEDAILTWERRGWLPRQAFRNRDVRRVFRPILFDRRALFEVRLGGEVLASEASVTRWAFR